MALARDKHGVATAINDNRLLAILLIALVLFFVICWRMFGHGNSVNGNQLVYHDGKLWFHESKVNEISLSISPCDHEIPAHLSQVFFQPVPINSASRELLLILPGIGESMAERIIVTRQQQRGFASTSSLGNVPGLGPKRLAQLQEHICFD